MKLQALRKQIDQIDRDLTRLLKRRLSLGIEVAKVKANLGLKLYSPKREHEVIRNVLRENRGVISEKHLRAIYRDIKAATRDHQRRLNRRKGAKKK